MRKFLKELVVRTPFESLARKFYRAFAGSGERSYADDVHVWNSEYDRQAFEVMNRVLSDDSNCVDVGCHEGSFLAEMLRLSPNGTHFAFEPLPAMFMELKRTYAGRPLVRILECAVSDKVGKTTFQHVVSNPGYSGLRRRRYDRPEEQIIEIEVSTDTLDRVIPADTSIKFIKVDVEGAELQVFKGGVGTITRNRPTIVFEHGLGGADHYGTTPGNLYDVLGGECGLRLFVMKDWLSSNSMASLDRAAFCGQFLRGENHYFMAAP